MAPKEGAETCSLE